MAIHEVTLRFDDTKPWEAFGAEHIQAACQNFESLWNIGLIVATFTEEVDTDELMAGSNIVATHRHSRWSVDVEQRDPRLGGPQAVIAPDAVLPVTLPFS